MGKSIRQRIEELGYKPQDVVDYTSSYGQSAGMEHFGVRDYLAWQNYLKEICGNANIGLSAPLAAISDRDFHSLSEAMVDAFTRKVVALQTKLNEQEREIAQLKREVQYYRGQEKIAFEGRAAKLLAMCKE